MPKVKISFNSPVILTYFAICTLVFIINSLTGDWLVDTFFSVYRASPLNPLTYFRLVGHVFGHVNLPHLFANVTLILVIGPMLEEKYGSTNIAIVILFSAVITGLCHIAISSDSVLLGGSGIVFAFILLSSFTQVKAGELPLTLVLVIVTYLGQEIYEGIFVKDNISQFTHIIGGGAGILAGYLLSKYRLNRYNN